MTRRRWLLLACAGGALACAEWAGPALGGPRLSIVPVFGTSAAAGGGTVLLDDLDQLRVIVLPAGGSLGAVVDTTVGVDAAGNARITLPLLVVGSAQTFLVQLQGVRSRDGAVLYSGNSVVTLQLGRPAPIDSVPVAYLGPCRLGVGCVVVVGPQNAAPLNQAASVPTLLFAGDSFPDSLSASGGVFCQNPGAAGRFHISPNGASGDVNPRYSPDRQRLAFTYRPVGAPVFPPNFLGVARWAGDTEVIAVSDTSAYRPRWSPNGAHLAFECGDGFSSDQDVCVFLDAKVPVASFVNAPRIFLTDSVTARPDGPSTFAWDPLNPDRIAFLRDSLFPFDSALGRQPVTSAIYVADFDGTAIARLTLAPLASIPGRSSRRTARGFCSCATAAVA